MKHPTIEQVRPERHYSVADAVYALNSSRTTVYRWIATGRLTISEKLKKSSRKFIKGWSIINETI